MAVAGIGLSPIPADSIEIRAAPVDTEHVFGFMEGADIGGKGEREAVISSMLRASRSTGSLADSASELEFKNTTFRFRAKQPRRGKRSIW